MIPPHRLVGYKPIPQPDIVGLLQASAVVTIIVAFLVLLGILIGYLAWGNRQH